VKIQDVKRGRKFGRTNVVAALVGKKILAPLCYNHSMNGKFFEKWFKNDLLPALENGSTITMDNASFHPKNRLLEIIQNEKFSHKNLKLEFLPTYSPDFNPIEHTWANMKFKLPNLIPKFDSLEKAIYSYLGYS
jgi:transposase